MNYSKFKILSYVENVLENRICKEIKDIIFNYFYAENELILENKDIKWELMISDDNILRFNAFNKSSKKMVI